MATAGPSLIRSAGPHRANSGDLSRAGHRLVGGIPAALVRLDSRHARPVVAAGVSRLRRRDAVRSAEAYPAIPAWTVDPPQATGQRGTHPRHPVDGRSPAALGAVQARRGVAPGVGDAAARTRRDSLADRGASRVTLRAGAEN